MKELIWPEAQTEDNDLFSIPVWNSSVKATFEWKEDWDINDFLNNHNADEEIEISYNNPYTEFSFTTDKEYFESCFDDVTHEFKWDQVCVYYLKDCSNYHYYLICIEMPTAFEDLRHAVCVPAHHLNLQLFMDWYLRSYVPLDKVITVWDRPHQ